MKKRGIGGVHIVDDVSSATRERSFSSKYTQEPMWLWQSEIVVDAGEEYRFQVHDLSLEHSPSIVVVTRV